MHQSVADAFAEFSAPLEGVVRSLYVDVKGLVTTGVGCLVDPVGLALPLPWVHEKTGLPATKAEIVAAWNELKAQREKFAKLHWAYAAKLNDLRLTDQAVDELRHERLAQNESILRRYFKTWDQFPADAQLACLSMAWACGAGFPIKFANFAAAANAHNWSVARECCAIRTEANPGVVPRNAQDRLCLGNAAAVAAQGLPLETLFWPNVAPSGPHSEEDNSPTWAELRARVVEQAFPLPIGGSADIEPIEEP